MNIQESNLWPLSYLDLLSIIYVLSNEDNYDQLWDGMGSLLVNRCAVPGPSVDPWIKVLKL